MPCSRPSGWRSTTTSLPPQAAEADAAGFAGRRTRRTAGGQPLRVRLSVFRPSFMALAASNFGTVQAAILTASPSAGSAKFPLGPFASWLSSFGKRCLDPGAYLRPCSRAGCDEIEVAGIDDVEEFDAGAALAPHRTGIVVRDVRWNEPV